MIKLETISGLDIKNEIIDDDNYESAMKSCNTKYYLADDVELAMQEILDIVRNMNKQVK